MSTEADQPQSESPRAAAPQSANPRRAAATVIRCVAFALVVAGLAFGWTDMQIKSVIALFITLLAGALWLTEAVPSYSVSLLVIALMIALLGRPGGFYAETDQDWEQFVLVLGRPLIWLFLGGLVLAEGMRQVRLDRDIALCLTPLFGNRPRGLLWGMMLTTFALSMIMSNTGATAMMLAMLTPMLAERPKDDRVARNLVLGVAVAANVGGMGSLIGTPPNAIAASILAHSSRHVSINFGTWLVLGLPPAFAAMTLAWAWLAASFTDASERLEFSVPVSQPGAQQVTPRSSHRWIVLTTLAATVAMWILNPLHGAPTAAVSLLPIVVFTTTGVLGVQQVRSLPYDVLFLLAGGLALGSMIVDTELASWLVERLPIRGAGAAMLAIVFGYATVLLSNFMSNTAAANLLIPIGVAVAGYEAPMVAIAVAFGASGAMCLPVATPPNALAAGTGRLATRDFLLMGTVIGVAVPLLGVLWLLLVAPWIF